MGTSRDGLAPHMRLLLGALTDAASCATLDEGQWDTLVRAARSGRLLGVLAARLERAGLLLRIPTQVAGHLRAALNESLYLRQMTLRQLASVAETLQPIGARLIALKGSAYVLRDSACAAGRLPRDVDILVEREKLDDVEQALLNAGWVFEKTDAYDQHYYRAWSHELPPMQAPGMPLELDVHHAILPPLGRLRSDAGPLLESAAQVAGSNWWTLCVPDQVLHAAVHLFQDSEWTGRLRDLVDIDMLIREALAIDPSFLEALKARALDLGLAAPLGYALAMTEDWLNTPVAWTPGERRALAPALTGRWLVLPLARRCLQVTDPDAEPAVADRIAASAVNFRAAWMRLPARLLAYHAVKKLVRSLRIFQKQPPPTL